MRSAFIEVRAIVEDLNARRQRGEQPENKCYESAFYRWHQAIAALAECVGSRKPPAVDGMQPLLTDSPTQVRFARLKQACGNARRSSSSSEPLARFTPTVAGECCD